MGNNSIVQYKFKAKNCSLADHGLGQYCYCVLKSKNISYSYYASISECGNLEPNNNAVYCSSGGKSLFINSNVSSNKASSTPGIYIGSPEPGSTTGYSNFINNTGDVNLCLNYQGDDITQHQIDTKYCNIINNSVEEGYSTSNTIYCFGVNATFTNCSFSNNGNNNIKLFYNNPYNPAMINVYDSYIYNQPTIGDINITENIFEIYTFLNIDLPLDQFCSIFEQKDVDLSLIILLFKRNNL